MHAERPQQHVVFDVVAAQPSDSPRYRALQASPARDWDQSGLQSTVGLAPQNYSFDKGEAHHIRSATPTFSTPYQTYREMRASPPRRRARSQSPKALSFRHDAVVWTSSSSWGPAIEIKLVTLSRQFKEQFLSGMGRKAVGVVQRFHRSLHLSATDRELLIVAVTRSQHFMLNVEALLRSAVGDGAVLERSTVNYAFLRWTEAHELAASLTRVLCHKHSGGERWFALPESHRHNGKRRSSTSHAAVPSLVIPPSVGSGLLRRATPTPRTRSATLPSYHSIAARWLRHVDTDNNRNDVGTNRSSSTKYLSLAAPGHGDGPAWRSAVQQLRLSDLEQLQNTFVVEMLRCSATNSDERQQHQAHHSPLSPEMELHFCDQLHRIRDALDAVCDGELEASEAAFVMWLSSLPVGVLKRIETLLAMG